MILGLPERFWAKTQIADHGFGTPCLIWTGFVMPNGYGRCYLPWEPQGATVYAHRAVVEAATGPIPDGMQVDHLCRNRRCVNLTHLEIVTPGQNTLRGQAPSILAKHANRCHNGHELTEENTYRRKNGTRMCKTCHRDRQAQVRARKKANETRV